MLNLSIIIIFYLGGNQTHDLRIRSTVTLPTELQGQTGKVRDDLGVNSGKDKVLGLTLSGLFMGSISTLIDTSELILCSTICAHSSWDQLQRPKLVKRQNPFPLKLNIN